MSHWAACDVMKGTGLGRPADGPWRRGQRPLNGLRRSPGGRCRLYQTWAPSVLQTHEIPPSQVACGERTARVLKPYRERSYQPGDGKWEMTGQLPEFLPACVHGKVGMSSSSPTSSSSVTHSASLSPAADLAAMEPVASGPEPHPPSPAAPFIYSPHPPPCPRVQVSPRELQVT